MVKSGKFKWKIPINTNDQTHQTNICKMVVPNTIPIPNNNKGSTSEQYPANKSSQSFIFIPLSTY